MNNCLILLSAKMISVEDFFEENFSAGPLHDFENTIKGFLVNVHPLFHLIPEFGTFEILSHSQKVASGLCMEFSTLSGVEVGVFPSLSDQSRQWI